MSVSLLPFAPNLARVFGWSDCTQSGPAAELKLLLNRISQRLYPESVPILASCWLKTIYAAGHNRVWWRELDVVISQTLSNQLLEAAAADPLRSIQKWIRHVMLPGQKTAPEVQPLLAPPFRPDLTSGQAGPYVSRFLNEWLPAEVARLLTVDDELASSNEGGTPEQAIATALERLLLRQHSSRATLELLVEAAWFSPKYVYPAHVEILRDIILRLLGRTSTPAAPILPVTALAGGFPDALGQAFLVSCANGDELHVPLDRAQALVGLRDDLGFRESIVVTMDGRWWQSAGLQSGRRSVIAYHPGGRLRIDFGSEHARLVVPWPDAGARWRGAIHLPGGIALFGRQWHGCAWESGAERTWLHLECSGALTLPETLDFQSPHRRRLRSGSIEMAWSELEQADGVETAV
jgi:hypothetical protein